MFTAHGTFLNEATGLHDSFVKECISRCSGEGAVVLMDTNPENPTHTVKVNYIDNDGQLLDDGSVNIRAFHFTLDDNIFLSKRYVESIKKSTPSGMYYKRDIEGIWVSAEGVVYQDFDSDLNYISKDDLSKYTFEKYMVGVDFGWEHYGSMVVIGKTTEADYIVLEEQAYKHKDIQSWIDIAKQLQQKYSPNKKLNFYCDYARPDYIDALRKAGIKAEKANKAVLEGISAIASLIKTRKLLVVKENVKVFNEEIYNYVWKSGKDEPVKQWDDVLDSIRYSIFTDMNYKPKLSVFK